MKALIDGDIVAYRCAASANTEEEWVARSRVNDLVQRILQHTGSTRYVVYINGTDNFRYGVYDQYKANRKDAERPVHLDACREQLVVEWQAQVVNGMETDDQLGIDQMAAEAGTTVICSIDKDLLMIPGKHYNFVKDEWYEIDEVGAIRHFWFQMIMGDRADNIPGYDGKMRTKVPKFLQPFVDGLYTSDDEKDMEELVLSMYENENTEAQFEVNKKLLWILREPLEREDT